MAYGSGGGSGSGMSGGKMSDKQKADLKKHMDKHKKDMSVSEQKSHRMKMMSRMRRGDSVAKAHKAIMGK